MNVEAMKHEWLSGGGEMSALIRATDWACTPLGFIESWPASLRTTVSLCLASNFPINIIWGPEAIQIYNTGYRVVCGAAHPRAPRDGFIDLSYHPFRESSGEISGILGTVVDVTEQVRARKTIEDVVSQLTEEGSFASDS